MTCSKCSSEKVFRGSRVYADGSLAGQVAVAVHADPGALFFGESEWGYLQADVCGDCGHVDFSVPNPTQLYQAWQDGVKKSGGKSG
jgi:hypothetical protein